jgi:hypothetical protein
VTVFCQCENSNNRIVRKIKIHESSPNLYNIVYENMDYKLYFIKSKFVIFVSQPIYRENNEVKGLVYMMATIHNTINFCDPYWEMDRYPLKYGVVSETSNGFDNDNSPGSIIDKNPFLKNSEIFEHLIRDYLMEGEVRIFDKESQQFLDTKTLNLIEWSIKSKDGNSANGDFYALPNGKKIIDRIIRTSV